MGSCKTVWESPWFSVQEEMLDAPPEWKGKAYYTVHTGDGVIVLPVTVEGKILLVRQYRPPIRDYSWEFPCGDVDAGENPEEAARRELLEETGRRCGRLVSLGSGRTLLNRVSGRQHLFLAEAVEVEPSRLQEPGLVPRAVTFEELKRMTLDGEFPHLAALGLLTVLEWKLCYFPRVEPAAAPLHP